MMHLLIVSSALCVGDFDLSSYNFDGNNGFSLSITFGKGQASLSYEGLDAYSTPPSTPEKKGDDNSSNGHNFSNGVGSIRKVRFVSWLVIVGCCREGHFYFMFFGLCF